MLLKNWLSTSTQASHHFCISVDTFRNNVWVIEPISFLMLCLSPAIFQGFEIKTLLSWYPPSQQSQDVKCGEHADHGTSPNRKIRQPGNSSRNSIIDIPDVSHVAPSCWNHPSFLPNWCNVGTNNYIIIEQLLPTNYGPIIPKQLHQIVTFYWWSGHGKRCLELSTNQYRKCCLLTFPASAKCASDLDAEIDAPTY